MPAGVFQTRCASSDDLDERHDQRERPGDEEQRARTEPEEREREEEQDRVGRQDHVDRDARRDEGDAEQPQQAGSQHQAQPGGAHRLTLERTTPAGDEPDRDPGERREEDRRSAADDGVPGRRVRDVERFDPQQVRREHAEHRQPAGEIDARDALRSVQPFPAGREVRAFRRARRAQCRRLPVSPAGGATPGAPSGRGDGSRPRPTRRSAVRR